MGRFSSGVKVLSRRLLNLESKQATSDLPKALQEYHLYGIIPEAEALRIKVELILAATEAMRETMP